jgi:hypothetical protein
VTKKDCRKIGKKIRKKDYYNSEYKIMRQDSPFACVFLPPRAQAWASAHFRDSSTTQEEETADVDWRSTSASLRPNITSEELIRDILAALIELGVVSTWGNNLALQQELQASDPVIARRIGILRLRFNPDSIPDAAAYRRLILLTSSGLQALSSTVSDFLRETQQE